MFIHFCDAKRSFLPGMPLRNYLFTQSPSVAFCLALQSMHERLVLQATRQEATSNRTLEQWLPDGAACGTPVCCSDAHLLPWAAAPLSGRHRPSQQSYLVRQRCWSWCSVVVNTFRRRCCCYYCYLAAALPSTCLLQVCLLPFSTIINQSINLYLCQATTAYSSKAYTYKKKKEHRQLCTKLPHRQTRNERN